MSKLIFGTDPTSLIEEWREEGLEPKYGSIENDLMVLEWEGQVDPIEAFKKEGLYDKYTKLVESCTISGTFYRSLYEEDDEIIDKTVQDGDKIEYGHLTKWIPSSHFKKTRKDPPKGLTLKLVCKNAKGLTTGCCTALAKCKLTVVSKNGNMITVKL